MSKSHMPKVKNVKTVHKCTSLCQSAFLLLEIRPSNVCSAEKLTKRSAVLLLRLVSFSAEQTLEKFQTITK